MPNASSSFDPTCSCRDLGSAKLTQRLSQPQDATEDLKRDYFLMNDLMLLGSE